MRRFYVGKLFYFGARDIISLVIILGFFPMLYVFAPARLQPAPWLVGASLGLGTTLLIVNAVVTRGVWRDMKAKGDPLQP